VSLKVVYRQCKNTKCDRATTHAWLTPKLTHW